MSRNPGQHPEALETFEKGTGDQPFYAMHKKPGDIALKLKGEKPECPAFPG